MISNDTLRDFNTSLVRSKVVRKKEDYKWCYVVNAIWNFLTFSSDDDFMRRVTTLGSHIYMERGWDLHASDPAVTYITLRHELRHIHYFENYGAIFGTLLYLFFPLPVLFAYMRYRVERVAVVEEVTAIFSLGGDYRTRVEDYVSALAGRSYFYAWPFRSSVRKWFHRELLRRNPDMSF